MYCYDIPDTFLHEYGFPTPTVPKGHQKLTCDAYNLVDSFTDDELLGSLNKAWNVLQTATTSPQKDSLNSRLKVQEANGHVNES